MDCQLQTFYPLETIEEELEQEDQADLPDLLELDLELDSSSSSRIHTRDEEHGDFHIQVGEEAKLAEAQSEEDEVGLRVMRARRKDSCRGSWSSGESRNSCPRLQVRLSQYENGPRHSQNSHIRGEGKKKRPRTYQKSTNGKLRKKASSKHEPFPRWLVDLMVNIEEATTHQLVVE